MQYHKEVLQLALKALNHLAEQRDIASITLSLTEEEFKSLKSTLNDFRSDIVQNLGQSKEKPTLVCQLNTQLFMTTEPK